MNKYGSAQFIMTLILFLYIKVLFIGIEIYIHLTTIIKVKKMSDLRSKKKDMKWCGSFYSCLNFIFLYFKLNTCILQFQRKSFDRTSYNKKQRKTKY